MKLIVGLGNPGAPYEETLHNVGFRVVEALAEHHESPWANFSNSSRTCRLTAAGATLLKPLTFMNESGSSVQELMGYLKVAPANLWVVHDDLDLPPGTVRVSYGASSAGHRGVASIIDTLGTPAFWRFRIGIGRPPEHTPAESYVLQRAPQAAAADVAAGTVQAIQRIEHALNEGIEAARTETAQQKLPSKG